ncbi:MAG: metal ABC transporter substrate-binding protein [Oscillospiraceae bacterium]
MNAKRKFAALIAALLLSLCLTACGAPASSAGDSLSVVATIYPEYDWVRNILGDRAADTGLTLLMDSGVDMHSFQPSADDIIKIASCDLFIYVGGESDTWVEDALKETVNPDMVVLNLLDVLGAAAKEEALLEGMEAEEEEEDAYDEHIWLSLKNAQTLCTAIADTLAELDPENAAVYAENSAAYIKSLAALDAEYQATVDAAARNTLLFADRFPFRYLADDYGLSCYAAFPGCSAETEASFETIAFLSAKVDELALPVVLTIEGSDRRIAETIIENTANKDQQILSLDSMQGTTAADIDAGKTYLSIMEHNLEILSAALN